MRTALLIAFTLTAFLPAAAQVQSVPPGTTSPLRPDLCPPTGDSMGQSNYQQATHTNPSAAALPAYQYPGASVGAGPGETSTEQPYELPQIPTPEAELFETTPAPTSIAVDADFVYVLRGNEVVKIDKKSMAVVSTTKLP